MLFVELSSSTVPTEFTLEGKVSFVECRLNCQDCIGFGLAVLDMEVELVLLGTVEFENWLNGRVELVELDMIVLVLVDMEVEFENWLNERVELVEWIDPEVVFPVSA